MIDVAMANFVFFRLLVVICGRNRHSTLSVVWIWQFLFLLVLSNGLSDCAVINDKANLILASSLTSKGFTGGGLYTGPYFDPFTASDISVQIGDRALLPCRVRQAANRSVSWVRKGNGDLLAVGDDMFISDNRFQAQRIRASDTWTLQIRSVRKEDSGDYECQVSANEPKISRIVHLRVVEPLVTIRGAPDMYVKHGSPVTLHCHIDSFLKIPNQVDWYLNRTLLSQLKIAPKHGNGLANSIAAVFDDRTGRSFVAEQIGNSSISSTLSLPSVSLSDSGLYKCAPHNMAAATLSFHVVIGEHPAAIHGDNGCSLLPQPGVLLVLITSLLLLLSRH